MVRFSKANSKIVALMEVDALKPYLTKGKKVYSFDLLSGHNCPFANECHSQVIVNDEGKKKIQDGPNTLFRCFSASQEVIFPGVYNMRKANSDALRALSATEMATTIIRSIPKNLGICRLHVGGDFFNPTYFQAWLTVVANNPDRLFYGYTKSLPYWVNNIALVNQLENLVLTASYGGRCDSMIAEYNLRSANVVNHPDDTKLEIDHTDEHAANPAKRHENFSLLIHGIQPIGSEASKGIKRLKAEKIKFTYGRKVSV